MKNHSKWVACLLCIFVLVPSLWAKEKRSVAVLPFSIHSAENIDYIRRGISDMLSSRISVGERIEVISPDAISTILKDTGGKELATTDI